MEDDSQKVDADDRSKTDAEALEVWNQAVLDYRAGRLGLALTAFLRLADLGIEGASEAVGEIYELGGDGVDRDLSVARKWYEEAIQALSSETAKIGLARCLLKSHQASDHIDGVRLLEEVSGSGNTQATLMLAGLRESGHGTAVCLRTAEVLYGNAASSGYVAGYMGLSRISAKRGRLLLSLLYRVRVAWLVVRYMVADLSDTRLMFVKDSHAQVPELVNVARAVERHL